MAEKSFKRLFEPIKIGGMTVKNRVAMPAMGTGFSTAEGLVTEQARDYYGARARGGAGLVIVEAASIDSASGSHALTCPVIDNDGAIPGLAGLARVIKQHGARAVIQLNHAGALAKSKLTGFKPLAPSLSGSSAKGPVLKELTVEEIPGIVDLFTQAAVRAKKAGFDAVEVHAAHGYLLAEFLSPHWNKRRDQYGGSLENRARMLVMVLESIRKRVGKGFPMWCRMNGIEFGVETGLTLEDARAIAKMVNGLVDAIDVSVWGYGRTLPPFHIQDTPGAFLHLAEAIKNVVSVPVIAVGRLTPELGEQAIAAGQADIIALGRELIADPDIPEKSLTARVEDIRPCIACFHCQDIRDVKGPMTCAVNAAAGREREFEIVPAKKARRIAVIGGGPAGMEAARVLTLRGHRVVLFEKGPYLGGQLVLAARPPHKDRIKPLITYFETQLKKLAVEVRLNTEASPENIRSSRPDAVVLATGSTPLIPQLPGINLPNVVTAIDILAGRAEARGRVAVLGGGSTGCETAEFLFEKGKEVTVVEMLPDLASDMGPRDRARMLLRITKLPITFLTSAKCVAIREDGLIAACKEDMSRLVKADTVVLALGSKPNNSLLPLLEASGFETYQAGDCGKGAKIADAISEGAKVGCTL